MRINSETKISEILKQNPEAIKAIIQINRHFTKLQNPVLRKVLAPRVSIAMAAQVGGCQIEDFFDALAPLGFIAESIITENKRKVIQNNITMNTNQLTLDVRPILDSGVDPFKVIMETLETLKTDEDLVIINTFEPIPLLNIITKKGYKYQTTRPIEGEVHTLITKENGKPAQIDNKNERNSRIESFEQAQIHFDGDMEYLDVRDLEMPMPMVKILEAMEQLNENNALFVHHKRLPQYLIPELEQRGFEFQTMVQDEDNTKLIIYKTK